MYCTASIQKQRLVPGNVTQSKTIVSVPVGGGIVSLIVIVGVLVMSAAVQHRSVELVEVDEYVVLDGGGTGGLVVPVI